MAVCTSHTFEMSDYQRFSGARWFDFAYTMNPGRPTAHLPGGVTGEARLAGCDTDAAVRLIDHPGGGWRVGAAARIVHPAPARRGAAKHGRAGRAGPIPVSAT
jgi:hypothetical protein